MTFLLGAGMTLSLGADTRIHKEFVETRTPAASTFDTVEYLEKAVIMAIRYHEAKIRTWLVGTKPREELYYEHESISGLMMPRVGGEHNMMTVHGVTVVLLRESTLPTGYQVLTAHPDVQ